MFKSTMKIVLIGFICSGLLACSKDDFHDLKDESLAKTLNAAYQEAAKELDSSTLSLMDCKDFYTEHYPEQNPFITKEAFIAKAKKECPHHIELLHQKITGSLAKRLTVEDLKTNAFWQQYDKSQELLVNKVNKR